MRLRTYFRMQCGLFGTDKNGKNGDLPVNETFSGARISNTRGTAAIAHFDVPDNGNTGGQTVGKLAKYLMFLSDIKDINH